MTVRPTPTQAALQDRADQREDYHQLDKAIAVMAGEVSALRSEIANLTKLLSTHKTPWWQYWAPIAFFLMALGGVYARFDDKIRSLEIADQASLEQRRFNHDRITVIENALRTPVKQ